MSKDERFGRVMAIAVLAICSGTFAFFFAAGSVSRSLDDRARRGAQPQESFLEKSRVAAIDSDDQDASDTSQDL